MVACYEEDKGIEFGGNLYLNKRKTMEGQGCPEDQEILTGLCCAPFKVHGSSAFKARGNSPCKFNNGKDIGAPDAGFKRVELSLIFNQECVLGTMCGEPECRNSSLCR